MSASSFLAVASIAASSLIILRLYVQSRWGRCSSKSDLKGQTVIITGANSGLGKETARELSKRNARIILACRDISRAQRTATEIRDVVPQAQLVVKHLDLASFSSIRSFVHDVLANEKRIDVLINNAGVFQTPKLKTEDGYELQFGVNHLGHFLLTNLLMERIKESSPSRVVIVSSMLHKRGKIDFDNLNAERSYDKAAAYNNSKLANVLFGRHLAKNVQGTGVDVLVLCPGLVWTNLGRHVKLWQKLALILIAVFLVRTPFQGCQTILHCASSNEVKGQNGSFYRNCRRVPFFPIAMDDDLAEKLWTVSEEMTGLVKKRAENV